jgi:hypothetical protein
LTFLGGPVWLVEYGAECLSGPYSALQGNLGVKLQARQSTTNCPAFSNSFLFWEVQEPFSLCEFEKRAKTTKRKGFLAPGGQERFSFGEPFLFPLEKKRWWYGLHNIGD